MRYPSPCYRRSPDLNLGYCGGYRRTLGCRKLRVLAEGQGSEGVGGSPNILILNTKDKDNIPPSFAHEALPSRREDKGRTVTFPQN
jgi:hypothetical protein